MFAEQGRWKTGCVILIGLLFLALVIYIGSWVVVSEKFLSSKMTPETLEFIDKHIEQDKNKDAYVQFVDSQNVELSSEQLYVKALNHENKHVRGGVTYVLAYEEFLIGDPKEKLLPLLRRALSDDYAYVRANAAKVLSRGVPKEKEDVLALIDLLRDENHLVRISAVRALALFHGEAELIMPVLTKLSKSEDKEMRKSATIALGFFPTKGN